MPDYHNLLGLDDIYDETFKEVYPLFKKLGVKKNHTIASESGYFVNLLNENGIPSSGGDIFSMIINLSKNRYPHLDFDIQDMRDFTLAEEVDLITCLDGCINHVFSLEEISETFQSVYRNLTYKGYFYFEFWTEEEVGNNSKSIKEKSFNIGEYEIFMKERRLGNNIHNMMRQVKQEGKLVEVFNAYHTSFKYDDVCKLLLDVGFNKYIELPFSNDISKKILAFKY